MSTKTTLLQADRRTAADELFDRIRDDIEKMMLLPGTKLSEAEVAKRYQVSRQPVREAFIRLDNLSLLHIQPQKGTIVKQISKSATRRTRFVREAVEIEVARLACRIKGPSTNDEIEALLAQQAASIENNDMVQFHDSDKDFHAQICLIADCEFAIDVITKCKAKTDRLCLLSLDNSNDAVDIYKDHVQILKHLKNKDEEKLVATIRKHLSRLDQTIDHIQSHHADYFED